LMPKEQVNVNDDKNFFYKKLLSGFILLGLLLIALVGYGIYLAFFDMNRLPTGEYLTEETSPDGKYTLKAYVTNGGATTSFSVRGELVFNEKNNKNKNIYWNNREETANITWSDNDTVTINGHSLDVPNDKFDFRNQ
jgi:CRISPR/Cas system-associated endonuclease Cas1